MLSAVVIMGDRRSKAGKMMLDPGGGWSMGTNPITTLECGLPWDVLCVGATLSMWLYRESRRLADVGLPLSK